VIGRKLLAIPYSGLSGDHVIEEWNKRLPFVTAGGPETGIAAPLGVAIDSLGNVWISNSAIVDVPCATQNEVQDYGDLTPDLDHASVTKLDSQGMPLGTFRGGGISIPWGDRGG